MESLSQIVKKLKIVYDESDGLYKFISAVIIFVILLVVYMILKNGFTMIPVIGELIDQGISLVIYILGRIAELIASIINIF